MAENLKEEEKRAIAKENAERWLDPAIPPIWDGIDHISNLLTEIDLLADAADSLAAFRDALEKESIIDEAILIKESLPAILDSIQKHKVSKDIQNLAEELTQYILKLKVLGFEPEASWKNAVKDQTYHYELQLDVYRFDAWEDFKKHKFKTIADVIHWRLRQKLKKSYRSDDELNDAVQDRLLEFFSTVSYSKNPATWYHTTQKTNRDGESEDEYGILSNINLRARRREDGPKEVRRLKSRIDRIKEKYKGVDLSVSQQIVIAKQIDDLRREMAIIRGHNSFAIDSSNNDEDDNTPIQLRSRELSPIRRLEIIEELKTLTLPQLEEMIKEAKLQDLPERNKTQRVSYKKEAQSLFDEIQEFLTNSSTKSAC